jgi:hypothetical protein
VYVEGGGVMCVGRGGGQATELGDGGILLAVVGGRRGWFDVALPE